MQNISASYDVIQNLINLNGEKLTRLVTIHDDMVEKFASYRCPQDNPMCNEKQKIQDFYEDFGMVTLIGNLT